MIKLKPLAVSLFIALGTGGFSALLTQGAWSGTGNWSSRPIPAWLGVPRGVERAVRADGIAAYLV